jgi:hypothetical protein
MALSAQVLGTAAFREFGAPVFPRRSEAKRAVARGVDLFLELPDRGRVQAGEFGVDREQPIFDHGDAAAQPRLVRIAIVVQHRVRTSFKGVEDQAQPILVALSVGTIRFGHQRMPAHARGVVEGEVRMNRLGEVAIHRFEIGRSRAAIGTALERAIDICGVFRVGGILRRGGHAQSCGDFRFDDRGFEVDQLSVEPADGLQVFRLQLLKLVARCRQLRLARRELELQRRQSGARRLESCRLEGEAVRHSGVHCSVARYSRSRHRAHCR